MAELYQNGAFRVRSYEVSIWTLQDRFVSVLKWAMMDQKGQIQNPEITLRDDGTQEFTFTIPQYYQDGLNKISNPLWMHLDQQPLEANMHKLKVIFNKNTEDEAVLEFLVISVTGDHASDEVNITIKAEGLAFHELGKTGYKINLSQGNYEPYEDDWFDNGYDYDKQEYKPRPLMNIQFWNDLIFKDSDGNWRTNWTYEVRMDWSSFNNNRKMKKSEDPNPDNYARYSDILYEDAYVSSWELQGDTVKPRAVENLREKERPVEISESNYYNVTQTIAEQFGVFCRYEYEHNDRYEIIGRKVIYYNNYIKDSEGHIDLTYPYSSQSITRTSDNTELTTKLFVHTVDDEDYGTLSIMEVEANKNKEEYILNFDYLIKVGAITEDQQEELKKFETQMHFLNSLLIENQQRTRIVQNQLIDVSAKVTYYTNAVQLDKEQKDKAEQLKNAITDGTGWVSFEKAFVVMDGEDLGYGDYVNITLEGLDRSSIKIYEKRLSSTGQTGVGYLDAIPYFDSVYDEYGNIIRLQHLARNIDNIDDSQVWIIGQYSPGDYYDKIIKVWEQRLIIDTAKLNAATKEEQDLNWYLYGSRVGYGVADGVHLDGEYSGIGLVWQEGIGPVPAVNSRDYNQYIDYELDVRVLNEASVAELQEKLPNGDISKITYDYFAEDDTENSTPDLIYYFEIYTKQKEKAVNAFERMMGPALREGYWQPEDYNDYGDVYYDSFTINYSNPTTPYLNFIWDHNKYYESEEPVIYQSSASGDMRQHLIIKVGNYLSLIKDHLNDLFFAYRDPISYETVDKLKKLIKDLSTSELDKIPVDTTTDDPELQKVYTIIDANYVSLKQVEDYWAISSNKISGINFIKEEHLGDLNDPDTMDEVIKAEIDKVDNKEGGATDEEKEEIRKEFYATDKLMIEYDTVDNIITNRDNGIQKRFNSLQDETHFNTIEIRDGSGTLVDTNYTLKNLSNIINYLEGINEQLDTIIKKYDEFIQVERNILKYIPVSDSTVPHSVSDITSADYPGHLEFLNKQKENVNDLNTLISKALNWYNLVYNYKNQINTIEENKEGYYRTYGIGADCELGWVIDQTQQNQELIPVLIVTGTDTVSEEVIKYIQTGSYRYFKGTVTEGNEKEYEDVSSDLLERCFLGYYATELKGANVYSYIDRIVELVPSQDFIGDASETSIQISRDGGVVRPIEIDEYHYQRVYPRLYFSTSKLRNASSKLRLKLNQQELAVNEDYYIVQDDRSKGLKTLGVGYYLTLRSILLYEYICKNQALNMDVLYTLLNADTSIYLDAIKVAKENAFPKVSYEVELSILNPDFIKTAYNRLNQIVHINDNELKLEDVSGYISSVTLKLDKPWEDTVEIKNYETKFEDLFSTIVAQTEAMKKSEGGIYNAVKAFNTYGFINNNILQDSILRADIDLSFNNGTLNITQNDGIWGISDAGVVAFRGGGIFTATTKDSNGNWQWNTGILPTGINADLITSGQIDTNRIKIYSGDDIRFQLNSEGLFAYKNFDIEDNDLLTLIGDNIPKNGVDSSQFVVYNSEGLFLKAKIGTWYRNNSIDEGADKYLQTIKNIDRVEVSWEGFILRDWEGNKVFYADPDTGNLILRGEIQAESGKIAGWDITPTMLSSDTIRIVSAESTNEASGIYLKAKDSSATSLIINNEIYYKYKYNNDSYCYSTKNALIFSYDGMTDVYNITYGITGIKPKYIDNDDEEHIYIMYPGEEESNFYILYTIGESPQPIEWDETVEVLADDLDPNNWYSILKTNYPDTYQEYVEQINGYIFSPVELENNTELRQVGNEPQFYVRAQDGFTNIESGKLGKLIVSENGLSGTKIDNTTYEGNIDNVQLNTNNYIIIVNGDSTTKVELGECFYNCTYNNTTDKLTFYKLNGTKKTISIKPSGSSSGSSSGGSSSDSSGGTSSGTIEYTYRDKGSNHSKNKYVDGKLVSSVTDSHSYSGNTCRYCGHKK